VRAVSASPQVTVRPAAAADFARVAALLAELGRPALTPATLDGARAVYERYVARADTAPLVAVVDDEVIGFLSLEFRDRLNHTTPQAWIPDLIVTEGCRGLGAGRALLERAFDLARERRCWSVTLESGYQRTVAHQLYRAAGMVDGGYYFTLELS
jgi:GNAT superfamily N-acetyltransferase